MITISVVIPLYNKAPHIAKCIESVLAQVSPADEIIVVDDGSTDGGGELVIRYTEEKGVRLIQQPNSGVSAARNRGIGEATSEYIAFLDADDYWLPTHLAVIRKLIEDYPQAGLYSTAHVICRSGRIYRPCSAYEDGWSGIVDDFFRRFAGGLSLVNSTTACVRKSRVLDVGGFPLGVKRGEDIICWVNLALKCPVAHAEVATAVYTQDAVNRSNLLREVEPPGSLQYIARLLGDAEVNSKNKDGLAGLFDRIAFYTAAGFKANGDLQGVAAIRDLAFRTKRFQIAFAITALMVVPAYVFQIARNFRHRRAASDIGQI